jgi:hypothetical protein
MQIPPQIQLFNQRIKQLNQSAGNGVLLSITEARNLHCEIFQLITKIAQLQDQLLEQKTNSANDAGSW